MTTTLDQTDQELIAGLRRHPRASVSELARRLSLARGTVQSRLQRLAERRVITGHGPDVEPEAAGYDVLAFTTLWIAQGSHDTTVAELATIPELLEVHTVTGSGDLLVKVVAKTNSHLHAIIQRITAIEEVSQAETHLALATPIQRTVADLIVDTVRRSS